MSTKCQDVASSVTLVDAETGGPLFGGAIRIRGCSTTIGVGEGSSSINITLLIDPCLEGTPIIPPVGTPATFTCGSLVFGGIINSISYRESSGGFEYTVNLIDPKRLLAGVNVLLTTYFCDPLPGGAFIKNFININSLLEAGVAVCPPGDDSQNWPRIGNCTNFGLAGGNNQGPLLWMVLEKIQSVYGGGSSFYTTSGRSIYISMGALVALLAARAPYARASGTSSSLSELINNACDLLSCDYMVLLEGIYATVYIIDRTLPPSPGYIQALVTEGSEKGILINGSVGKDEIYAVSNNFILGDNVNYLAERSNAANVFAMMLGEDINGEPVRVYNSNFTASINITPIIEILAAGGYRGLNAMFSIKEEELLSCGTLSAWRAYGLFTANKNSLSGRISAILGFREKLTEVIKAMDKLQNPIATNAEKMASIKTATLGQNQVYTAKVKEGNAILVEKQVFEWLQSFVNTYYGRHWLIPMNGICKTPPDPGVIKIKSGELYELTDQPVTEGYPSPSQNNILGLTYGVNTTMFESGNGKIQAFVAIPKNLRRKVTVNGRTISQKIDFGELRTDECQVFGNYLYVSARVDGTMYKNRKLNQPEVLLVTDLVPTIIEDNKINFAQGIRAFTYLYGIDLGTFAKKDADKESLNTMAFKGATAGISYALVPMKSNIYVYGPWFATAGALGATNSRQDTSLNPWTCGGWGTMGLIGQSTASLGVRPSNEEESGSMTLAEPPGHSIQSFLSAGVAIDSIVVSYGEAGATTTYSFKQHQQKFGNYNQTLAEMMKKRVADRNIILGRLRKLRLETEGRVKAVGQAAWRQINVMDKASPGFCLVGSYVTPTQSEQGTTIPTRVSATSQEAMECKDRCKDPTGEAEKDTAGTKEDNTHNTFLFDPNDWGSIVLGEANDDIKNYAAVSLDAIFAPVSLEGRGGRLPRYVSNWSTTKTYSRTRPSMPPIKSNDQLAINQKYLNPILSKKMVGLWDARKTSNDDGVYISRISFGTDIDLIASYRADRYKDETDFGFFSLKGPLVLQSWGYDTENKPIPNAVDTEGNAIAGKFVNSKLKNKFMVNWLKNPKTWPVGPIDLRYDRERGVWVSPPAERVVVAQLKTQLKPKGSADAILLNPAGFYEDYHIDGKDGVDLGSQLGKCNITVFDYLGNTLKAGTTVYVMHNDQKYIVIGSNSNPDLIKKTGYPITADNDCVSCEEEPEEFCEHDACGLSDCIKDLYGRTLLPVKEDGITQDTSVAIPWGSLVAGVGPFGRKSKLPAGSSFASGVLGIDPNGCLKIYLLTSCTPAPATPSASPKPSPPAADAGTKVAP